MHATVDKLDNDLSDYGSGTRDGNGCRKDAATTAWGYCCSTTIADCRLWRQTIQVSFKV